MASTPSNWYTAKPNRPKNEEDLRQSLYDYEYEIAMNNASDYLADVLWNGLAGYADRGESELQEEWEDSYDDEDDTDEGVHEGGS